MARTGGVINRHHQPDCIDLQSVPGVISRAEIRSFPVELRGFSALLSGIFRSLPVQIGVAVKELILLRQHPVPEDGAARGLFPAVKIIVQPGIGRDIRHPEERAIRQETVHQWQARKGNALPLDGCLQHVHIGIHLDAAAQFRRSYALFPEPVISATFRTIAPGKIQKSFLQQVGDILHRGLCGIAGAVNREDMFPGKAASSHGRQGASGYTEWPHRSFLHPDRDTGQKR